MEKTIQHQKHLELKSRIQAAFDRHWEAIRYDIKKSRSMIIGLVTIIVFLLCIIGMVDQYIVGLALAQALGLITSQNHPILFLGLVPITTIIGFFIAILLVEAWSAFFGKKIQDKQIPSNKRSNHLIWFLPALLLSAVAGIIEGTSIYGFRMFKEIPVEILFATTIPIIFLTARIFIGYHQARWIWSIKEHTAIIKNKTRDITELGQRHDNLQSYIDHDPDRYTNVKLEDLVRHLSGEIEIDEMHRNAHQKEAPAEAINEDQDQPRQEETKKYIYVRDTRPPSPYSGSPYNNGFTRYSVLLILISVFLIFSLFNFGGCLKSQDPNSTRLIIAYDASLSMDKSQEMTCLSNFVSRLVNAGSNVKTTFIVFGKSPVILFTDLAGIEFSAYENMILSTIRSKPSIWKESTDLVSVLNTVNSQISLEESEDQGKDVFTSFYLISDLWDDPLNTNSPIIPQKRLQNIADLLNKIEGKVNKIVIFQANPNALLQYQPFLNNLLQKKKMLVETGNPGNNLCSQLRLPEIWSAPKIKY